MQGLLGAPTQGCKGGCKADRENLHAAALPADSPESCCRAHPGCQHQKGGPQGPPTDPKGPQQAWSTCCLGPPPYQTLPAALTPCPLDPAPPEPPCTHPHQLLPGPSPTRPSMYPPSPAAPWPPPHQTLHVPTLTTCSLGPHPTRPCLCPSHHLLPEPTPLPHPPYAISQPNPWAPPLPDPALRAVTTAAGATLPPRTPIRPCTTPIAIAGKSYTVDTYVTGDGCPSCNQCSWLVLEMTLYKADAVLCSSGVDTAACSHARLFKALLLPLEFLFQLGVVTHPRVFFVYGSRTLKCRQRLHTLPVNVLRCASVVASVCYVLVPCILQCCTLRHSLCCDNQLPSCFPSFLECSASDHLCVV